MLPDGDPAAESRSKRPWMTHDKRDSERHYRDTRFAVPLLGERHINDSSKMHPNTVDYIGAQQKQVRFVEIMIMALVGDFCTGYMGAVATGSK
nr:hypothetical protein CFP56_04296 [Quercus suber]